VFRALARARFGGTIIGMREPRIKVDAVYGPAEYHCRSKTVNGDWLFDDVAKEIFRRQLWPYRALL
jgi:hypothetical protein